MMQRDIGIDMVRAIGILLVVIGHAGVFWPLEKAIYSMHMPLFFLLAGTLYREMSIKTVIIVKQRTLIVPYLITATLTLVIFGKISLFDFSWVSFISSVFAGDSEGLYFNSPLWFLPCLFSVFVLIAVIGKFLQFFYLKLLFVIVTGVCFTIFIHPVGFAVPLRVDTAISCLPFFCAGMCFSWENRLKGNCHIPQLFSYFSKKTYEIFGSFIFIKKNLDLVLAILYGVLWIIFSFIDRNAYYVIAHGKFGSWWCFYTRGLTGSLCVVFFCRAIAPIFYQVKNRFGKLFLRWGQMLSAWSFCIFLFHKPIMTSIKELTEPYRYLSGYNLQLLLIIISGIVFPVFIFKIICHIIPRIVSVILGNRLPVDTK